MWHRDALSTTTSHPRVTAGAAGAALDRTVVAKIESGRRRVDAVELLGLSECLNLPFGYFLHERPTVLSRRVELLDGKPLKRAASPFTSTPRW
jgi:transcriptional regulator with XRE-family HTH domain